MGDPDWLALVPSVLPNSPQKQKSISKYPRIPKPERDGVGGQRSQDSDGENEAERGAKTWRSQFEPVVKPRPEPGGLIS